MGNMITFVSREVKAKGLKKSTFDENKLKDFFLDDEYCKFSYLDKISKIGLCCNGRERYVHSILQVEALTDDTSKRACEGMPPPGTQRSSINKARAEKMLCTYREKISLFYPGSGCDILSPLIYTEKLFSDLKAIDLIFVEKDNDLGLIKTILDDLNISFAEKSSSLKNKSSSVENVSRLSFYWKDILVHLEFIRADVFSFIQDADSFDVYFEKAFRIMKDGHEDYETLVLGKLKTGGLLISDSGFAGLPEDRLKKIDVPRDMSSYNEMIMGIKIK